MVDKFEQAYDDEEIGILVSAIIEEVLFEYDLKKLPENGTLAACLDAYTKEKLLFLADENGFEVRRSWKKGKIVHFMAEAIMSSIEERLLLFKKRNLDQLKNITNGKYNSPEMNFEEVDFYLGIYSIAVSTGLLYSKNVEDEIITTMPNEIKEKLEDIIENYPQVLHEYQDELRLWSQIDEVFRAGVNLYGVMSINQVIGLWEIAYADSNFTIEDFFNYMVYEDSILNLLAIHNGFPMIDDYLIASPIFEDAENTEDFYAFRQFKMDATYYEPTKQEIKYYADHSFDQRSPDYKRLVKFVNKVTADGDFVMDLIKLNIISGGQFSDFMNEVNELELIIFNSDKEVMKFADLYIKLHNNSRLWENAGFTPSEMSGLPTDEMNVENHSNILPLAKLAQQEFGATPSTSKENKKVSRNDLCPCGSGEKYKKCCLKKDRLQSLD